MNIIHLQAKLGDDWEQDLCDLQDDIMAEAPVLAFYALTYPIGVTFYFMAAACGDRYSSVSIGQDAFETALGALYDGQPPLDT